MTAVRLASASDVPAQQRKGAVTASTSLTIAGTSYADIQFSAQDWVDVGNAPTVGIILAWTQASGTLLSVRVWVSHDDAGTLSTKTPYIPSQTTGTTPAYPQVTTFASTDWIEGAASVIYCPLQVFTAGFRYIKIEVKSNNASGSIVAHLNVGPAS